MNVIDFIESIPYNIRFGIWFLWWCISYPFYKLWYKWECYQTDRRYLQRKRYPKEPTEEQVDRPSYAYWEKE